VDEKIGDPPDIDEEPEPVKDIAPLNPVLTDVVNDPLKKIKS
jgi:hypothetical protein